MYKLILSVLLVQVLAGCSSTPEPEAKPYQQSLLVKCQETLPELDDGTAGEVLVTMTKWAGIYHACKTRHNGLIDAIRQ